MSSIKSQKESPKKSEKEKHGDKIDEKKSSNEIDAGESIPPYTALVPEQWLEKCYEFKKFHIMKFHRIFQSLFYFVKYVNREDICEFDTNKLEWKKAKEFLAPKSEDDIQNLFAVMGDYTPFGQKEYEFTEYQKLKFI